MLAPSGIIARRLRGAVLAAALLVGLVAAPPSASGGTIGISGTTLIAGAGPGDGPMALTAFVTGTDLVLDGVDFTVVTPGCTAGPATVSCALSGFTSLLIIGSSGDDVISLSPLSAQPFTVTVLGKDGDDVLLGSAGNEVMFGGLGDDTLLGGGGIDLLDGGLGDNFVFPAGGSPGPEPDVTPLPGQSLPAPGGPALLLAALGALATSRRKR